MRTPVQKYKAEVYQGTDQLGAIHTDTIDIDGSGVGIVYRPSSEELNKMNEEQSIRDAKEAMAETLRNTPAPTI